MQLKTSPFVALRKESVDKNLDFPVVPAELTTVALRKESVDRNQQLVDTSKDIISRSPQGERG